MLYLRSFNRFILISLALLGLSVSSVNAALVESIGGQAYFDDVLNITWLTDANIASSNNFGVPGVNGDGSMDWNTANDMTTAMNGVDYLGTNTWRLPTLDELLNLRNVTLGNPSVIGIGFFNNSGPFINLIGEGYWSGSEFSASQAFAMGFGDGNNFPLNKSEHLLSMFVFSGDVSAVPVPAAVWLFGTALIGLVGFGRRKKAV